MDYCQEKIDLGHYWDLTRLMPIQRVLFDIFCCCCCQSQLYYTVICLYSDFLTLYVLCKSSDSKWLSSAISSVVFSYHVWLCTQVRFRILWQGGKDFSNIVGCDRMLFVALLFRKILCQQKVYHQVRLMFHDRKALTKRRLRYPVKWQQFSNR